MDVERGNGGRIGSFESRNTDHTDKQYYILILLMMVYVCHNIDRTIVSVIVEPMKKEFGLSDKSMGLIPLVYSFAFICAVFLVGLLIDRVNRVRLLCILVAVWSMMTAAAGMAQSLIALAAARMAVGMAEAGGQPASLSLIADIFPQHRRGSALGIFYLSTGIGGIIAFLFGGIVAADFGWRVTFFLAGLPGLLLVPVILFTVREPSRGGVDDKAHQGGGAPPSPRAVGRFLTGKPAARHALLAPLLSAFALAGFLHWIPAVLMREHGMSIKQAGATVAIAGGLLPAIGALIFGMLADRLARRKPQNAGYVSALATFMMAAMGIAMFLPLPTWCTVALTMVLGLFGGAWMAPAYTMLLGLTPANMRGTIMALCQMGTACGAGLGPYMVGVVSDMVGQLGPALASGAAVGLWASFHHLRTIRLAGRTM